MSTYILVHGAWHGSWCWKRVRAALQRRGHDVFTPTLTGVAERSHLLSPQINLETHIQDVVNLIRCEELSGVVLCGHSYGGCVIRGVADRIPDRIGALVYLDAFILENGQSLHDVLPPDVKQRQLEAALRDGEGWKTPPIPAEVFKVNAQDAAWVNRQCTMQPLATFTQALTLTGKVDAVKNVTYIQATGWDLSTFQPHRDRATAKGWKTFSMPCGHDVMLDLPEELSQALIDAVPHTVASNA